MTRPPTIPGLPPLTWRHAPATSAYDPQRQALSITAGPGTDWFVDPVGEYQTHTAPALLFACPTGEFALSARVTVGFGASFDAGVLCLRVDETHWAKLCFERSPQGEPMVVSVVTNGTSDDANAVTVAASTVDLRILRKGQAYAFHWSPDGVSWRFVRLFRLADQAPAQIGFLSQAPVGSECTSVFERIRLVDTVPADLRDGS